MVGIAEGKAYGNALNWHYDPLLDVDQKQWQVSFNDWMFLQDDKVRINRAKVSKYGFTIGEITLFFSLTMNSKQLQSLHHVAISVTDISRAIEWYSSRFQCELKYQDDTWALLKFANIHLALVMPDQHPPHIALEDPQAAAYGSLTKHRDGTSSIYIQDSEGNHVEIMQA